MPFFSFSFTKSSPSLSYDDDELPLPGAWASVWSLHQQPDQSTNGQRHLRNERHHASSILSVHQVPVPVASNAGPTAPLEQSIRNSVDLDDDLSLLSEDYHSFDSHAASEAAPLSPSKSPDELITQPDHSNVLPSAVGHSTHSVEDYAQHNFTYHEDPPIVNHANDSASAASTPPSSIQPPDITFGSAAEMVYGLPRSSSCLLGIPEHSATPSSPSSRENSIYSNYPRSLTTDSPTEESDSDSTHSLNLDSNHVDPYPGQTSTSTIDLLEPRQTTFLSQLSITSSLGPDSISSPPSSFQALDFAQPDGDNSWTLSLDPTSGAHGLSSQASSSSLATTSSSIHTQSTHEPLPPQPQTPTNASYSPSPPPQSTTKGAPRRLFLRERVVSTPYRSQASSPSVNFGTPTHPSFGESVIVTPTGGYAYGGSSRDNIPRPEPPYSPYNFPSSGEDKSKNVLRKTKAVVTKIKQLFNAKPGKRKFQDADYLPRSSASPTGPLPPPSSPMSATFSSGTHSLRRTISPSSSVYQSFGMPRSIKLSTPSVTFSSMQDSNSTRTHTNSNLNLADKLAYEYHARPKTLDEIRSKRRFSLPNVLAGSGSRSTPSSSSYNMTGNSSMTRIGLRPVSTRRNTDNVPT